MSLASNGAYQGASRDTNYGVLITMMSEARENAIKFGQPLLSGGMKIVFTGDLWSDGDMALFGSCAHGITADWEMGKCLVAATPCGAERHTVETGVLLDIGHV